MTIRIVGLEDLFDVRSSKRVLKSEWRTSGVPFFRGREVTALAQSGTVNNQIFISEEHYRSLAQSYGVPKTDDILVTAIGTIGNTYIVQAGDRFYFKDASVLWLEKKVEVNSRYVRYWFASNSFREQLPIGNGATVDTLPIQALSRMKIELPNLAEQQRIVAKLDELDADLRTLSERLDAELLRSAQVRLSVMNEVFLQRPGRETQEPGRMNKQWSIRSLDDLCESGVVVLGRGSVISKKDIAANLGTYPIYSSARENDGKFGEYGTYMFDEEMITWSIDGGGRLFYRPKHKFSVTNVGGTLRVLRPDLLRVRYLHLVLEHLHSRHVFDWVFKAHPSVIRKVYDAIPIPLLAEQQSIVAKIEELQSACAEISANIERRKAKAGELRQSVLAAAFRGDL